MLMYSIEELCISFIISIAFIYIFKLQRKLFNQSYWATSDILSDVIDDAPTLKLILIRFLIILSFGISLNFFVLPKIIILGMTLGAFLIVWPVFLNDENIIEELRDKKLEYRTLLALFVAITYVIAKFSIALFNLLNESVHTYLQGFSYERIVNLIGDSLLWAIILILLRYITNYIKNNISTKVTISPYSFRSESDDKNNLET